MFCPNCGKETEGAAAFCRFCGSQLPQLSSKPEPPVEPTPAPQPEPPVEPAPAPQPEPPVEPAPAPQPEPPVEPAPAPQPEPPVEPAPAPQPEPPVVPAPQPAPQPRPQPAPQPVKPAAPRPKKDFAPVLKRVGLSALLVLLYAGIALLFFLLLDMEETIALTTLFDDDVCGYLTFREYLTVLTEGNRIFYPTVASTALAMGMHVLIWAVPVFGLLALIGAIVRKGAGRLYAASCVVSCLTAALTGLIVPLSMWLIPGMRQALAVSGGVIFEDLDGVRFVMLMIFAAVALVLVVAAGIVTGILNKRRA